MIRTRSDAMHHAVMNACVMSRGFEIYGYSKPPAIYIMGKHLMELVCRDRYGASAVVVQVTGQSVAVKSDEGNIHEACACLARRVTAQFYVPNTMAAIDTMKYKQECEVEDHYMIHYDGALYSVKLEYSWTV